MSSLQSAPCQLALHVQLPETLSQASVLGATQVQLLAHAVPHVPCGHSERKQENIVKLTPTAYTVNETRKHCTANSHRIYCKVSKIKTIYDLFIYQM